MLSFNKDVCGIPPTISIAGSLNSEGITKRTVCIITPDVRDDERFDHLAWQDRFSKILLIRSWRLPNQWGTSKASIDMAESLGFIIGAYTLHMDLPALYITDSNNARTPQRNV
jgi:hypothetical protein